MSQNLAVTTSLNTLASNIRRRTGTTSIQGSLLIDPELIDIIHSAVVQIRTKAGSAIDDFYHRNDSVTFSAIASGICTVSITAVNIADMNLEKLRLTALLTSIFKEIPILPLEEYNQIKNLYSTTAMSTTGAVGVIYLSSATPNLLTLEVYTGASTIGTALFGYYKNPTKVTTGSDTMDIPETFIPAVEDLAVQIIGVKNESK